jgi:hypothetical protein
MRMYLPEGGPRPYSSGSRDVTIAVHTASDPTTATISAVDAPTATLSGSR